MRNSRLSSCIRPDEQFTLTCGLPLAGHFSEGFAKSLPDFDLFEYVMVKATQVVCALELLRWGVPV